MINREEYNSIETGDTLILSKRLGYLGKDEKKIGIIRRKVLDGSCKSIVLRKLRGQGIAQYTFDKLHKRIIEIIKK